MQGVKIKWGRKNNLSQVTPITNSNILETPKFIQTIEVKEPTKYQIAEKFEGTYITDYNILDIHYSILHKFEELKKTKVPQLQKKLIDLKNDLNISQKPISRKTIIKDIENIETEIYNINNDQQKKQYLDTTHELISKYQNLTVEKKVISFKSKKILTPEEIETQIIQKNNRLKIIKEYIDIAGQYIKINLIQEIKKKNECTQCQFDFSEIEEEIDFCLQCGLEHKNLLKIPPYSDYNVQKSTDEKNFIKEIKRFQGLQNNKIPDSLLEELDTYFIGYGFLSSADVKKSALNSDGERIGTNHNILYEALNKTNNSAYYEDINLILNLYWGYPLPNISNLEDGILDDYRLTQKAFLQIPKNRSSSLNIKYRLYKHLQLRGYKCKATQFKIIKTDSIVQKYAELWKQMCEISGLKYYPD